MKRRIIIGINLLLAGLQVQAQSAKDTTAWINEFNKVMGFMSQSYVYYSAQTRLNSVPVLDSRDTASFTAEFYKDRNNFYSHTDVEELYKEDSFMIQVNKDRKTIWLSKVDMNGGEDINLMPIKTGSASDLVKKNYSISRETLSPRSAKLILRPRRPEGSTSAMQTEIVLEYSTENFLPQQLEISITLSEPADEEVLAALKEEGIKTEGLIRKVNGMDYLVRTQKMSTSFNVSGQAKEKVRTMPSYKDVVSYDAGTKEFTAKGVYSDYEVTKTF